MRRPILSAVERAVLGASGRDRLFISQTLLACVLYVFFAGMQYMEVLFGMVDRDESNLLTGCYLSMGAIFYGLVRSGASKRFSEDPALTLVHRTFGVLIVGGSYAITGPARGGALTLLVLLMTFAMFTVRPAQARRLALSRSRCFCRSSCGKAGPIPCATRRESS